MKYLVLAAAGLALTACDSVMNTTAGSENDSLRGTFTPNVSDREYRSAHPLPRVRLYLGGRDTGLRRL